MNDLKLPTLKCIRCNHTWIPRLTKYPKVCPHCNSPYWNKKYVRSDKVKEKKNVRLTKEDAEWIAEKTELGYYHSDKRKKRNGKVK